VTEAEWQDVPDSPLLRSPIVRVQEGGRMYRLHLANGQVFEVRGDYLENVDIYEIED
jgi:hypothetical protein